MLVSLATLLSLTGTAHVTLGVEVIVHADDKLGVSLGGAHDGAGLCGAVPWVVHPVRVADGLNLAFTEVWELPAGPEDGKAVYITSQPANPQAGLLPFVLAAHLLGGGGVVQQLVEGVGP